MYHPGNAGRQKSFQANPIRQWAIDGSTALQFPAGHLMSRFRNFLTGTADDVQRDMLLLIGRVGDTVAFSDLHPDLQTAEFAAHVGATVVGGGQWDGSEACGACARPDGVALPNSSALSNPAGVQGRRVRLQTTRSSGITILRTS